MCQLATSASDCHAAQAEGHEQKRGMSGVTDANHAVFFCNNVSVDRAQALRGWLPARRRYLVSVVDNDYVQGDLFSVLEAVPAGIPAANGNGAAANGGHAAAEPERRAA